MKLVDANTLVYAVHQDSPHHGAAHRWFEGALCSAQTLLLPWVSLIAFVRITTHPRLFERPLRTSDALQHVREWLSQPNAVAPEPDARHLQRVAELLAAAGGQGGNLVNDAHLAALALQWGATVVTFDRDFGRFPGVRWEVPAA